MTFAAIQALVSGKRPIWLYEITMDGTTNYLSRGTDYTYNAQLYTQTNVAHSRIVVTQSVNKAEVVLTFPRTNALAQTIRDNDAGEVGLVIKHGYSNDPDQEFVTKFAGRVIGTKPMLGTISLQCENNFTAFRRRGIAAVMQRPCRHALYHAGCGLAIGDFNIAGTATAYTGGVLTVTEASGQADGYYNGGVVTFGTAQQMILSHVGTSLTLLAPVSGLASEITASGSAAITTAPGCNRSMTDCATKFTNIANFGGFPYMTDSPFDGRNVF